MKKNPDSGLRAEDLSSNCFRHSVFSSLPLTVKKRTPHCKLDVTSNIELSLSDTTCNLFSHLDKLTVELMLNHRSINDK